MKNITIHTTKKKYKNKKEQTYHEMQEHRKNMETTINIIAETLKEQGKQHDHTKQEHFNEYYQDTIERKTEPIFKNRKWYKIHTTEEKHHLTKNHQDTITLLDIIEMITDHIITGKTTGKIKKEYLQINPEILEKAYWNTIQEIQDHITLKTKKEVHK